MRIYIISHGEEKAPDSRVTAKKIADGLMKIVEYLLDPKVEFISKDEFRRIDKDNTWFSITQVTEEGNGTPEKQFNAHLLMKFISDTTGIGDGLPTTVSEKPPEK
jgi:hypothetical protein